MSNTILTKDKSHLKLASLFSSLLMKLPTAGGETHRARGASVPLSGGHRACQLRGDGLTRRLCRGGALSKGNSVPAACCSVRQRAPWGVSVTAGAPRPSTLPHTLWGPKLKGLGLCPLLPSLCPPINRVFHRNSPALSERHQPEMKSQPTDRGGQKVRLQCLYGKTPRLWLL